MQVICADATVKSHHGAVTSQRIDHFGLPISLPQLLRALHVACNPARAHAEAPSLFQNPQQRALKETGPFCSFFHLVVGRDRTRFRRQYSPLRVNLGIGVMSTSCDLAVREVLDV